MTDVLVSTWKAEHSNQKDSYDDFSAEQLAQDLFNCLNQIQGRYYIIDNIGNHFYVRRMQYVRKQISTKEYFNLLDDGSLEQVEDKIWVTVV